MSGATSAGSTHRSPLGWVVEVLVLAAALWGVWLLSLGAVGIPDMVVGGLSALACGLAAAVKTLGRPMAVLHAVHSGRVGDYVAWLMVGVAMLAGLVGLPLR